MAKRNFWKKKSDKRNEKRTVKKRSNIWLIDVNAVKTELSAYFYYAFYKRKKLQNMYAASINHGMSSNQINFEECNS